MEYTIRESEIMRTQLNRMFADNRARTGFEIASELDRLVNYSGNLPIIPCPVMFFTGILDFVYDQISSGALKQIEDSGTYLIEAGAA